MDRQSVHIGPKHDNRAFTIAEYPDYSGFSNARCYLITRRLESLRGDFGRPVLLHRQFGVGMNVFVNGFKIGNQRLQIGKNRLRFMCRFRHISIPLGIATDNSRCQRFE